jgi:hypothetical protein
MAKCRTRRQVRAALQACGLSQQQAGEIAFPLMRALDALGYVVAPIEPSPQMLHAASTAMRRTGWIEGDPWHRVVTKHAIRLRAMLEAERKRQGLDGPPPPDAEAAPDA